MPMVAAERGTLAKSYYLVRQRKSAMEQAVQNIPDILVKDNRKYLGFPPEVVVEVDIKAELDTIEGLRDSLGYVDRKTKELFKFGVKKVIWVLTDTEKVVVAEAGQPWTFVGWDKDIPVLDECSINVKAIVDEL